MLRADQQMRKEPINSFPMMKHDWTEIAKLIFFFEADGEDDRENNCEDSKQEDCKSSHNDQGVPGQISINQVHFRPFGGNCQ